MAGLLSGRIDFVVGALRAAPGDAFVSQALLSDEAALIARAGHPLAERKQLALRPGRLSVGAVARGDAAARVARAFP
jgi:DNA-binding transcriptional LysR family regulator